MNIGKIIKITENKIYVGYGDGDLKEIAIESCDFEPKLGDYVEIYKDIVIKVVPKKNIWSKKIISNKVIAVILLIILLFLTIFIVFGRTKNHTTNKQNTPTSVTKSNEKTTSTTEQSDKDTSSEPTIDTDKTHYDKTIVDYDKWNHDELPRYLKVKVSGQVVQVIEGKDGYLLRVALNELDENYSKVILVSIPYKYFSRVIAENDSITLYGKTDGRKSYKSTDDSTVTLPYMVAYMYEN